MRPLRSHSISRTLMLLMVFVSGVAVLLACVGFAVHEIAELRRDKASQFESVVEVLARNSTAALAFEQSSAAADLLATLEDHPAVEYACLLDRQGRLFAEYCRRPESAVVRRPGDLPQTRVARFLWGELEVAAPVREEGETLGWVWLRASTAGLVRRIGWFLLSGAGVFALSLVAAAVLAARFHRVVSDPILHLAQTAEQITARGDYSLRGRRTTDDEIGLLYDQFNGMLDRIQRGEAELRDARQDLERRVTERTDQLCAANAELKRDAARRAELLGELERSARMVRLLQEISASANQARDVESAVRATLDMVCRYAGWPVGHALWAAASGELVSSGLWHVEDPPRYRSLCEASRQVRISPGEGCAGEALQQGRPSWRYGLSRDAACPRTAALAEAGLQGAFAIPIIDGQRVAAVLEFFHNNPAPPDDHLLEVVNHVGGQLAHVFERRAAAQRLAEMNRQLFDAARRAGMAEVATGVLHNVGNILNSVNVAATLLGERLTRSELSDVERALDLIRERREHLAAFITEDPRGKHLPDYLLAAGRKLRSEHAEMAEMIDGLLRNVEHIKAIIGTQQDYTRVAGLAQPVAAADLIEDALRINAASFSKYGVEVVREYADLPEMVVDKHRLLQALVNLIKNAKEALQDSDAADKRLIVRTR